jgi:hypothetical protein
MRYRDAQGQWRKSKGTARQIINHIREGRLPNDLEVARLPHQEYQALAEFPEFRAAVASKTPPKPEPDEMKRARSRRLSRPAWSSGSFPGLPMSFWVVVAILLLAAAGVGIFLVLNL